MVETEKQTAVITLVVELTAEIDKASAGAYRWAFDTSSRNVQGRLHVCQVHLS